MTLGRTTNNRIRPKYFEGKGDKWKKRGRKEKGKRGEREGK